MSPSCTYRSIARATPARRAALLALALSLAGTRAASAQTVFTDSTTRLSVGGFVDSYFAWDGNRPSPRDRQFTTQPARHAEFNVNLAMLYATVERERVRGRLALQAGTSVQSNYAGEPTEGAVSGPDVSRTLQEAWVGARIAPNLWVDAGIFYSNMGMESWESDANPTYTRSLVADFSPFYSTGVRLQWQASERVSARLDVVNGWQNISESNSDKAVGTRIDVSLGRGGVSWYTFAGDETGRGARLFTGLGATAELPGDVSVLAQADVGSEPRASGDTRATWYGGTLIARRALNESVAVVARVERYVDRDQVILSTGRDAGFDGNGASLGLDVRLDGSFLWRTEVRGLQATDAVFDTADGTSRRNTVFVSSLSLRF